MEKSRFLYAGFYCTKFSYVWGSARARDVELRYNTLFLPSRLIHIIKYLYIVHVQISKHVFLKPFSGKKPTERAKVMFPHEPENPDELKLFEGDIITIRNKDVPDSEGWWEGEVNGKVGLFPNNFVELLPAEEEDTSVKDEVVILILFILFWLHM